MAYRKNYALLAATVGVVSLLIVGSASAGDWPTWRADANRSAAADEQLPASLSLNWTIKLPPLTPAWNEEDSRIHFDACYEPIVVGRTMVFASSRNNSVTAIDTRTAATKWRVFAEAPVRFAPVAADGAVYFGADDGRFYCVDMADGKLRWQFDAAPSIRKVLGNDRLISVWPMRGGPVLSNGKIYFTAGVWPFEGVFLYILDAKSGAATDKVPQRQIRTLRDATPQGYLVSTGSRLYIPCGRSVVTGFDLENDRLLDPFQYNTHDVTTVHVSAMGRWLFHGKLSYDAESRVPVNIAAYHPVLTADTAYFGDKGDVAADDLRNPKTVEFKDRKGKPQKRVELQELWRLPNAEIRIVPTVDFKKWIVDHPLEVHIKAGNRLYAHQENDVCAIDLPEKGGKPRISWKTHVEGTPSSMLAADGRLFVVTREGQIQCFGSPTKETLTIGPSRPDSAQAITSLEAQEAGRQVESILAATAQREGIAIVLGVDHGRLIRELVARSNLRVIAIDPVAAKVNAVRQQMDEQQLYGHRVTAIVGDPLKCGLPPYLANLIISEDLTSAGFEKGRDFEKTVFTMLRPYGGTACFQFLPQEHDRFAASVAREKLANAEIKRHDGLTLLSRVGALPGSADWTHEFGDPANTLMSQDTLVKAPLGVLWFGGPAGSGDLFYNRHQWGPSMTVIGGRMFIQGPGKLTAVDVYTGRVLWQVPLEETGRNNEGRRGNDFENKLAGFNYLAVDDGIYLVDGRKGCLRFDPATGKRLSRFTLPDAEADWGTIRVQGDLLVAEAFRKVGEKLKTAADAKLPVELIAMNRHTGAVVWSKKAEFSFPIVAISGDKLFCFDGTLENFYRDNKRKGLVPKASETRYLKALDLKTGNELWKYTTDVVATWMNYSTEHDVLLVSNRDGISAFEGKSGNELWKKYAQGQGFKGHPENLWDKVIVWNDRVIDQRGPGAAYDIKTGDPVIRRNPITNKPVPWEFTKSGHHCNYAVGSPNLLTFRAAEAGFCDIASGTTSRLQGFRSGCRNSLIPADGILNAPNFAHGCSCGFSLFTSLALVNLPQSEVWGYSALNLNAAEDTIERVGINFGAPGDRLASNGTLWLDYPNVGGSSPAVTVTLNPDKPRWFQQHSSLVEGDDMKWVAASGFEGDAAVTIALNAKSETPRPYTVRLYFMEPDRVQAGARVFDVALQGDVVLKDFDVVADAGKPLRAVIKEFRGIRAGKELKIDLRASRGKSVLSGVEILAE